MEEVQREPLLARAGVELALAGEVIAALTNSRTSSAATRSAMVST